MAAWWLDRLARLVRAGIAGFRCLDPDHAPASLWRRIIAGLKPERCRFLAWTPGVERSALPRLEGAGFDHVCSSLAWWDGRANWLVEEVRLLRRIGPVMASPEASFAERRAARLVLGSDVGADYRLALRLAAATGSGVFVPMGFEYAARRPFDAALGGPDDFRRARDEAPADLTADLAAANALIDHVAEYRVDGELRQLTDAQDAVTALLRSDAPDLRNATRAVMVLANPDIGRIVPVGLSVSPLPPQAGAPLALAETREDADAPMDPGEVRVLAYAPTRPVIHPIVRDHDLHRSRLAAARGPRASSAPAERFPSLRSKFRHCDPRPA
jgi:starch synthase (maltosyl-transferring)